ncbi:uncharacterized protein C14orf93-like [Hippoglossus hippoglossus]|uniref:uncharacterized protein C14orf93-like n=1 Tax=Hippoglossus hippoglossus TaxID=8267 RepID=UPI00148DAF71|nr:uncharacterized protein C14orf93-like [Hippoglossus hippoglossus]
MPGRRVSRRSPVTPPRNGRLGDRGDSPEPRDRRVLDALGGLSRQMTEFAADLNQKLDEVNITLLALEERMTAVECKVNSEPSVQESKRKRRAHNPKIAETVRRVHNSESNGRRYEPEQGLSSAHNEAVTEHLVEALAATPGLRCVEHDVIISACKTYYETLRRNFRYSQPDLVDQAAALKSTARSRQRRKRLLEARQSVLVADDLEFWRGTTIDMMSDEEDGTFEGGSGWIVRRPSFRSQELTDMCATLQTRLEGCPKYTTTHHRRLHTGENSDRVPPRTYDPEAAKRHFKPHMIPQVRL